MPLEPSVKRAVAFIDGQNLFHAARESFGHTYPNYDVSALARTICDTYRWGLTQVRFYTGIPDTEDKIVGSKSLALSLSVPRHGTVAVSTRQTGFESIVLRTMLAWIDETIEPRVARGPRRKYEPLGLVTEAAAWHSGHRDYATWLIRCPRNRGFSMR